MKVLIVMVLLICIVTIRLTCGYECNRLVCVCGWFVYHVVWFVLVICLVRGGYLVLLA